MFAPGKPFQPSLLLEGKARSLPYSGAPEFTWAILERLASDKHSSLFQKIVTYDRKKFYNLALEGRKMKE